MTLLAADMRCALPLLPAPPSQGLAKSIAWDGEGATCLMEIEVTGAKNEDDARVIARSVAGSSLAKVRPLPLHFAFAAGLC